MAKTWAKQRPKEKPLTLEEWKQLTRELREQFPDYSKYVDYLNSKPSDPMSWREFICPSPMRRKF